MLANPQIRAPSGSPTRPANRSRPCSPTSRSPSALGRRRTESTPSSPRSAGTFRPPRCSIRGGQGGRPRGHPRRRIGRTCRNARGPLDPPPPRDDREGRPASSIGSSPTSARPGSSGEPVTGTMPLRGRARRRRVPFPHRPAPAGILPVDVPGPSPRGPIGPRRIGERPRDRRAGGGRGGRLFAGLAGAADVPWPIPASFVPPGRPRGRRDRPDPPDRRAALRSHPSRLGLTPRGRTILPGPARGVGRPRGGRGGSRPPRGLRAGTSDAGAADGEMIAELASRSCPGGRAAGAGRRAPGLRAGHTRCLRAACPSAAGWTRELPR